MLIFRLFFVSSLVLLHACASSPEPTADMGAPVAPEKIVAVPVPKTAKKASGAIDPDVMFMLMTAELAGQRGRYDIALEGYLEAAKRVKDARFAERAAMIAMYLKDAGKTKEATALWLSQDKNSEAAHKVALLAALTVGDKKAAVDHIGDLLRLNPAAFEKTIIELFSMQAKEDKGVFAYGVMNAVSEQHPENATLYFVKALLAMQANNTAQAELDIDKALQLQPAWDKALTFKAQVAMLSGNVDKAILDLRAAVAKFPNDNKIKKLLAQLLIKAKDYKQSAEVYRQIVKADASDFESQFALALVYIQLGDDDNAENELTGLLKQSRWQDQARYYLGRLEEKRGNNQDALDWYSKVGDSSVAFDAGVSSALLLSKDKQFASAMEKLKLLAERYPNQKIRLLLTRAEVLNQQKQYQQAYTMLSEALVETPDNKDLLYSRALMADRLEKIDSAEADFKKILAKSPDSPDVLNALGYTLVEKTKRYAEAEQYLLHALKLSPNEAVILDSYGWLQFKKGNLPSALDYLQRAYDKQKESEIVAHLAEVLWVLGKKDEAKKLFKEAIKQEPNDEYLLEFKQRILDKDS